MAPPLLLLPDFVWRATSALLEPYVQAQLECGLYWYGVRVTSAAVVTVAGIPEQINRPRNFAVGDDDLARLTRAVPEPLVVVGAIHTHPGSDTTHSDHDDERAVSRKIFSLVLPFYGRCARLENAGVHEFQDGSWRTLPADDARRRIVLIPPSIDTRSK